MTGTGAKRDLVKGYQTKWDDQLRQTHYAQREDGKVLVCADIPYPAHVSNFGVDGKWQETEHTIESLRASGVEIEWIGFYPTITPKYPAAA